MKAMGIDPGIANTGDAIVVGVGVEYRLILHGLIETKPALTRAERLRLILSGLLPVIASADIIAVERVFFGKNVTSAISTAQVIGSIEGQAALSDKPIIELTPPAVKAAIGRHKKAGKNLVVKRVQQMFSEQLSHHAADATAVAMAGLLVARRR